MPSELEVIEIFHELINPPDWKMVVCLNEPLGLFININTKGLRIGSLSIPKAPHHSFLDHDSNLECGRVYEFDDYLIGRAKVIGRIHELHVPDIIARVDRTIDISGTVKRAICDALTPFIPTPP
jgi:hypothetical protein